LETPLPKPIAEPIAFSRPARRRLWDRPYLLLALTSLIFAGHAVIGKLAVGEIGPMTLTFLRWSLASCLIGFAARRHIAQDFPILRRRWLYVASLGALGYTSFNALFYLSAHYTSALNMALIQSCIPALVLIGAGVGFGARPTLAQALGAVATMAGVATVAAQGDFARLAKLALNFGDALLLIACLLYAYYTLALRYRPPVASISFLAGLALAALVTSIPPFLWEIWRQGFMWPSAKGLAALAYAALGPAFVAQLSFMRGVQLIGPGRAGVFVNLVPIFGAFFAVALLGEPLAAYHLAAMALVVGGIALAQVGRLADTKT
jgi:drug/metabolite transporter (DMT)-like permease